MTDDEKAREDLGIKQDDWIITVNDEELIALKAALRSHADISKNLADKIEKIG